jgi:hypothetical protein
MLRLLIDTSTWLDVAKRRDGQKWVVPLRVFVHWERLELLVPSVVLAEFERNRPHVEASVTASVRERFRLLRQDVHEFGGDDRHEWLEEMSHQIPMLSSATLQNFSEIHDLLVHGRKLEPSSGQLERVVRRGLAQQAPFRRAKNSTADALIIEQYSSALREGNPTEDQYCFATSNHEDFSAPADNRNLPHPDIASFFESANSRYCYGIDGLTSALEDNLGDDFRREVEEIELIHQEPRSLAEILEAEHEFFEKVWYIRALIRAEKSELGEREAMTDGEMERMERVTSDMAERYGADSIGPWDDWGWGFVNGKLSALRWVLGDEWDFLDT